MFEGGALLDLLEHYYLPSLERMVKTTAFSNRMATEMFGRPWSGISPDFWRWRALERVPEESDQCPYLRGE